MMKLIRKKKKFKMEAEFNRKPVELTNMRFV